MFIKLKGRKCRYVVQCEFCKKIFGEQEGEPGEISNVSLKVVGSKLELERKIFKCGWQILLFTNHVCKKCLDKRKGCMDNTFYITEKKENEK